MGKLFEWVIENLDFVITVAVAMTVSVLVSLGYIPIDKIPVTTLGVLITLTLFLAVKNFRLSNKVNSISSSLQKIEHKFGTLTSARVITGTNEFFQVLNSLLTENSKLDVTYFSPTPPNLLAGKEIQEYWKTLSTNLRKSQAFRVRRIVTIENLKKLEWVRQTISDSKSSTQYHLAILSEQPFPLLNLVIVDNQYVILFGPHIQETDSHYIFVDNPKIATVAIEYFQSLWAVAKRIKVGQEIDHNVFTEIENRLSCKLQEVSISKAPNATGKG
jgi:hypothetical protein